MLEVKLVCVGRLKERWLTEAAAEYSKRLTPYCRLSVTELAEARLPREPGEAEIRRALETEADAILTAAGKSAVIPLCIEGATLSSEELAAHIERLASSGVSSICFVIGSSFGLSPRVKAQGKGISLSRMTFPHQLARVMLLEQLYRAFSILAGTKYHK